MRHDIRHPDYVIHTYLCVHCQWMHYTVPGAPHVVLVHVGSNNNFVLYAFQPLLSVHTHMQFIYDV